MTLARRAWRCLKLRTAQLRASTVLRLLVVLICSVLFQQELQAQSKYDFYRYPFRYSAQLDPLGFILGRVGGRFEKRQDPLTSYYLEVAFQPDVKARGLNVPDKPSLSLGLGERVYLIDNSSVLGPFAGFNGALAWVNHTTLGFRLSAELGVKYMIPGTAFYIEPELLFDSYLLTAPDGRRIFPYVAIPLGFLW